MLIIPYHSKKIGVRANSISWRQYFPGNILYVFQRFRQNTRPDIQRIVIE